MPFNILLLPLLGGFIFISRWNRTRWHTQRAEKERLLFSASIAGLIWLIVAFLVIHIPPPIPCVDWFWCFPRWWSEHHPFPHTGVSLLALALGATAWWPLNRLPWFNETKEGDRIIDKEGSELEQLLDRALKQGKRVMITLKGGKVYVGRIVRTFSPGEPHKGLFLLPTKSGYRESDKQRVILTTDYDDAYANIKTNHPTDYEDIIKDFGIVLVVDEILTITIYSQEIHAKYFPHKTDPPAIISSYE